MWNKVLWASESTKKNVRDHAGQMNKHLSVITNTDAFQKLQLFANVKQVDNVTNPIPVPFFHVTRFSAISIDKKIYQFSVTEKYSAAEWNCSTKKMNTVNRDIQENIESYFLNAWTGPEGKFICKLAEWVFSRHEKI